ncbi:MULTISPECIES: Hcp family type VI secretion system effector [unclassified Roseateles]|jgi:type VI secretion system secreted protein Hcp|uniref:Hcp family type VI secretion system effector n=1 Tax=Roseateles TaxID=93681 RepID=UPI0007DCEE00|nr:type VI secretion system tube protein Hcp [Mitsuaria sp. 7]ANH67303.1 type VI secretion protein [Mitsuaria sp. 7]OWQ48373.1 Hcp1 family type VI secretion system effector [Roseateles noduli]
MTIDANLKFAGVEGESTHKDHKGEIDLLAWSWDVRQESTAAAGTGSGKGKGVPGQFVFAHYYDKASPVLAKACASGKHFDQAVLTCRKAGEGQQDFLKVTLKQVLVTAVSPSASAGGEISESVSVSYADIEFEYKAQDAKGGLGGAVKFGWNVATTETR